MGLMDPWGRVCVNMCLDNKGLSLTEILEQVSVIVQYLSLTESHTCEEMCVSQHSAPVYPRERRIAAAGRVCVWLVSVLPYGPPLRCTVRTGAVCGHPYQCMLGLISHGGHAAVCVWCTCGPQLYLISNSMYSVDTDCRGGICPGGSCISLMCINIQ